MRQLPFFKIKKGWSVAGTGEVNGAGGGGGGGGYTLPIASADTLGGVKVGEGLSINASGVLSASGGGGGGLVIADTEQEIGTYGNDTLYSRHFDVSGLSGTDVQFTVAGLSHCLIKTITIVSNPTTTYGDIYVGNINKVNSYEGNAPYIDAKFSTNLSTSMHFDLTVTYTKAS